MSLTLTNQYLGLSQDPIDHNASSIINAVCGNSTLLIGDAVKLLPVGIGVGFTQNDDLLPRIGLADNPDDPIYGIVVGGDFEGIYRDGTINLDANNLAEGIIVSFFGDGVRVCTQGRALALADGTVPIGINNSLTASSNGLVKATTEGSSVIAIALQPTSVVNSIIAVDVKREGLFVTPEIEMLYQDDMAIMEYQSGIEMIY